MPNFELDFAKSFNSFSNQLLDTNSGGLTISEPPGARARLEVGSDALLSNTRKDFLLKQYVSGLVHPLQAFREKFSERAMKNIKDPAERAWLTEKVREVSRAKEHLRRRSDAKAGYWQRFKERALENVLAPLEGMTRVRGAFVGPNRLIGGKFPLEDIQFRRGLETAKLSENPYISKEAGILTRGVVGAGEMIPDVAAGGVAFVAGGAPALMAYSAMRVAPEAVERSQEMGLSGAAAGVAGLTIGAGVGLLEAAGARDPTGLLKKGLSPLAVAGRKAIIEFAQKTFPAATKKGGTALTKRLKTKVALREAAEYFYRGALEVGEEGSQGAWEESVNVAASLMSENVDPREKWSIPEAFIRDVKESALPIALIGTAGPIVRATGADKAYNFEEVLREHHKKGTVPSRREWSRGGMEKATVEERKSFLPNMVEEFNISEIVDARVSGKDITQEQHDKWNLPPEAGKTPKEWGEYINRSMEEGRQMEDQERVEIQEPPRVTPEAAPVSSEAIQQVEAPEVAPEPEAAPEAPAVPAAQIDADQAADLNNAAGEQFRLEAGLKPLEGQDPRTFDEVLGHVVNNNLQKGALAHAKSIVDQVGRGEIPRLTTDRQHVAMMVKTHDLLNELDENRRQQEKIPKRNATEIYRQSRIQETEIINDLDLITQASQYSGTEVARALNIRRLRKSREDFSAAGVLSRFRLAKGSSLTTSEKGTIADVTKEYSKIEDQTIQIEMEDHYRKERREKLTAKKLIENKKGKGKRIKEAAVSEIDDIKNKIRALGYQVHDVTELTANGLYLVGRLGIAYAKSGIGSIVEIVEKLQADMPELQLTEQDIYQAINTRDPKKQVRERSNTEKRVRDIKTAARILSNIGNMAEGIAPEITKRAPTSEEIKKLQKEFTKARSAFYKTDIEAGKIEKAIDTINHLQDMLGRGEKIVKKEKAEIPSELLNLRQQISELRREMRIGEEVERLDEQIRTGEYAEPKRVVKKQISRQLEKKQIELAQKRQEIRQLIDDAKPWDLKRKAKLVAAELKAIAATADMSFTMRQNLWQVFAHPIRNVKPFIRSLGAFFSENSAQSIANSIRNLPNAELYELSGLTIMDPGSPDAQNRSEVFRGRVIENLKIPFTNIQNPLGVVMSASSRHSVAIGNLVRISAFDFFMENNPNATQLETKAMADYINKSTGLGDIGRATAFLQEVMFSPKFAASRFQTPWTVVKYWQTPRVRNAIATDMVRMTSTGMLILLLAQLAGSEVEYQDLDSPDFGKIRVGDSRYDIFGGFLQPTRLMARLSIAPFTGREELKKFDSWELIGRFASYKAAPVISASFELAYNKTVLGEETTKLETIGRAMRPLIAGDIADAWRLEGAASAAGVAPFAFLGGGAATYRDSWSAAKRRRDNFRSRGEHSEAKRVVREFNMHVKPGGRKLAPR